MRTVVENDFRIKEMNAEERATFQNKGNWRDVYKETKVVETTGLKFNVKSEMDTLFLAWLFPWTYEGFKGRNQATPSSTQFLCNWRNSTLIKILLFLRCQECQKVLRNWSQNNGN